MTDTPTPSIPLVSTPSHVAPKAGFDFMGLAPLAMVFFVFYFLVFRPQQKKVKQQRDMLNSLRRGDKVVTNGGIVGTISKIVSDTEVMVEVADNLSLRFARSAISDVVSKTGTVETISSEEKETSKGETKAASSKRAPSRPSKVGRK
jgi:preprotein translocase subunit YajC